MTLVHNCLFQCRRHSRSGSNLRSIVGKTIELLESGSDRGKGGVSQPSYIKICMKLEIKSPKLTVCGSAETFPLDQRSRLVQSREGATSWEHRTHCKFGLVCPWWNLNFFWSISSRKFHLRFLDHLSNPLQFA